MDKPDFSIEVDQPEGEIEKEIIPKIKPTNVSIIEASPAPSVNSPMPINRAVPINKPVFVNKPLSTMAETIEISNPQSIFPHIEPYPESSPKQHHFRFKHKTEHNRLIHIWNQIDPSITAVWNESANNNVDLTLMRGDHTVGKIQLLHFDRRDRKIRSRHYVKIYLYQFEDSALFEKTKQIMIDFFGSIQIRPHHRSHKRTTHKKRIHRKGRKTFRRVHRS
jgi:hypothetical protein